MEKTFFESGKKVDCNGCGICAIKCPQKAISMIEDSEGFLYPSINKKKCSNCGLCKRVCSNRPLKNKNEIKVYIAKNKNNSQRKKSTSGGMFILIASEIIKKDGIVFGVKFDDNLMAVHDYATTIEDCEKFSSSKYIRSDMNNAYNKVEQFLSKGKYVLFTGTPCQCYALKKYLNKEYERLITCEIVCHSNPSPKIFKMFISNLEKKYNKKIIDFKFRNKEKCNKPYAITSDGRKIINETYNTAFGNMLISRPSCSKCEFCDLNRKADITIGDFWGAKQMFPEIYDENGISLICINSENGRKIFEKISKNITYSEVNINDAFKFNHNSNMDEHSNKRKFFEMIEDGKINEKNIIKYMNKFTKRGIVLKIKNKLFKH